MNSSNELVSPMEMDLLACPSQIADGDASFPTAVLLPLEIVLGRAALSAYQRDELSRGSVIELDRSANDRADLVADGRVVAHGEVVVLDGRLGIRIVELVAGSDSMACPPEK